MRQLLIAGLCLGAFLANAQKPKLVVGIVVDQMRYDYLIRYESKFTEGGFKKLMREGFNARNTHYDYIPTYTAPGHASIYTGTTPRYHGIIGNEWYSRVLDREVYCTGDSTANHVGGSAGAGKMSPRNLMTNTITDELKLTSNFRSKVVAVSIKDRGAILPGGHEPDGAYWYDSRTGQFMTSDYYTADLPEWVKKFNSSGLVDQLSNQVWSPLLPLAQYVESTSDDTPYERGFKGKDTPTFPYDLKELREKNGPYGLISSTPFGNTLVTEMGKAAVQGERLGADEHLDFLCISYSSPDYIGHNFGTMAVETEDTYLRLDRELAGLLDFLDKQVGKGQYTIFLTADHGAVSVPQWLMDHGMPGGYLDLKTSGEFVQREVQARLGKGEWILNVSNDQVFLNHTLIRERNVNFEDVERVLVETLMQLDEVMEVIPASSLQRTSFEGDALRSLAFRGYHSRLSGDLLVISKPGYLPDNYGRKGTSHGTGFTYDTHVPLLFWGAGVKKGSTVRKTTITDITPTLAFLLNLSLPNAAVSGSPITELFE